MKGRDGGMRVHWREAAAGGAQRLEQGAATFQGSMFPATIPSPARQPAMCSPHSMERPAHHHIGGGIQPFEEQRPPAVSLTRVCFLRVACT